MNLRVGRSQQHVAQIRRVGPGLHDGRFEHSSRAGSIDLHDVASSTEEIGQPGEFVDVVLRRRNPHNRYALRQSEDSRVIAASDDNTAPGHLGDDAGGRVEAGDGGDATFESAISCPIAAPS